MTEDLSFSVPSKAGSAHGLVLGFAVRGKEALAVGGQRFDVFLKTSDGVAFRPGQSLGKGLRGAWWTEHGLWVVGEYGYCARSEDDGASWEKVETKTSGCLFGVVQDPIGNVIIAGDGGYVASSKDGVAFKKVSGVKESIGRIVATNKGVLVPTDKPGKVYVYDGKKIRPTKIAAGSDVMTVAVTARGTIVGVGGGGLVFRSEDDGATMTKVDVGTHDLLAGVDVMADGRVVAVGASGLILVSEDDGKSFTRLSNPFARGMLWCVKRYQNGALIGGQDGLVVRIESSRPAVVAELPAVSLPEGRKRIEVAEPKTPFEHWQAPRASTARQEWAPQPLPIEKRNGVYWTPELRALLHPRRGGADAQIRPLPTLEEAWARLRRALFAANAFYMQAKPARSKIWDLVTSLDGTERRLGERVSDLRPRVGSFEEDAALVSLTLQRFNTFVVRFQDDVYDATTDFLVASVGLHDALKRAYAGLDDELPHAGVGPFERFRELLVLESDEGYSKALDVALAAYEEEYAKAKAKNDRDRAADLSWATSFVFPLGFGTGEREAKAHENALKFLTKFGNFGAHAAGLASGNLDTLDRYRHANPNNGHEFFYPVGRRYLAAMLDLEGGAAASAIAALKLRDPWTKDEARNWQWAQLLAHIESDVALEALFEERQLGMGSWGTLGLQLAARIDFDRVHSFVKRKGDAELAALVEAEKGKPLDVPDRPLEDPGIAPLSKPTPYVPPEAKRPIVLANPLGLAAEVDYRDEERQPSGYAPDVQWNGEKVHGAKRDVIEAFVAHMEKWAIPAGVDVVLAVPGSFHPRLFALGFTFHHYWVTNCLHSVMSREGAAALPALLACLQDSDSTEAALATAQGIGDVSMAPTMAACFAGKKLKAPARNWMLRHPKHAAAGALEMFQTDANPDAARMLRFLDARGHRSTILDLATKLGCSDAVARTLDEDPLALPKVKRPVLPAFAKASALPKLVATKGHDVPDVDELLVQLAFSNADEVHPGVIRAKASLTPESRAAFAWALFEAWLAKAADPKQGWCMQAVGFFGDDECARKLTALAKAWPGQQASARAQAALDVLLNIGTDAALVNLNLLAEKSKFPAFKAAAKERIDAIAMARGLTSDELADRLVPTLGLDEEGGAELDFGPRKFIVAFDETLMPVVKDAAGAVLEDLPKPTKADDAAKAKAAKARLSAIKKDAKTTASLQIARLERAMVSGRPIARDLFLEAFAGHPWMRHIASRLVFGAHRDGALEATFRVAEDGTLADADDKSFRLAPDARVAILHPLRFPKGQLERWSKVFGDYEVLQPFPQLARQVFEASAEEMRSGELSRFHGRKATYGQLRGLEGRGWEKWMDDSVTLAKPLGKDRNERLHATLETSPGWHPSQTADSIEEQTVEAVQLDHGHTFAELDPIAFSELVLDLTAVVGER